MTTSWASRTGGVFVLVYLIVAGLLFHQALTCTGWACDLVALPVALPLGLPTAWLIDRIHSLFPIPGHLPSFHFRHWYFIVPTVSANAALYYWLGRQCETLVSRFRQRQTTRR